MSKGFVLATGFGIGEASAEYAATGIEKVTGEVVDPFTLSDIVYRHDAFRRATRGKKLVTQSAGALAFEGTRPDEVHFISAPLPTSIPELLARTGLKMAYMLTPFAGIRRPRDVVDAARFMKSSGSELLHNLAANFVVLSEISRYDGVQTAIDAAQSEIPTWLTYTNHDLYYQLSGAQTDAARSAGVSVHLMAGQHDESILHPERFFAAYFDGANIAK